MTRQWAGLVALAILLGGAVAVAVICWRPAIEPAPAPPIASFSPAKIAAGARLAALGDCATCHAGTAGQAFAGGAAIQTPFGAIHATNITPDTETGIGGWTFEAFRRAMVEGVSRDGRHLYPAFPYPHFTGMGDEDIAALYAFFMTRPPVHAAAQANHLGFPFGLRPLLAGWKLLYMPGKPFCPDPSRRVAWNRGAYLVKTIGHCGACHTPRNALGAERRKEGLAGGQAEGWDAPPLTAASTAPVPWTEAQLFTYLRTGFEPRHGAAAGPMAPVVAELATVPDDDLQSMAIYLASMMSAAAPVARHAAGHPSAAAATVFAGACASCHGADAQEVRVPLALSTILAAPQPNDAVRILLAGLQPPAGRAGPFMPGFADVLTDEQITGLLLYLREEVAGRPGWTDIADSLQAARRP
jgi:mono/diheme cytochrome c family protein